MKPAHVPLGFLHPVFRSVDDAFRAQWLAHLGLSATDLFDPDAELDVNTFDAILEDSALATGNPAIGLVQGERADVRQLGVVAGLMVNSPHLGAAIEHFVRYQDAACRGLEYRFLREGSEARLVLESSVPGRRLGRVLMDGVLRSARTILGQLAGRPLVVRSLSLALPRPADAEVYRRTFGVEARFRQAQFGFTFDAEFLDEPLAYANAEELQRFTERAEAKLAGVGGPFEARVRSQLLASFDGHPVTLSRVAEALAVSPRTIQARLQREGVTFQEVLDQVRRTVATTELAKNEVPIKEVAWMLGFAELPSFYTAFRKWTNQTPAQYRRSAQGA